MKEAVLEKALPFSLEAFKKGNPTIVTRKGNSARILCTDRMGKHQTIVALVRIHGREDVLLYNEHGIYNANREECARDLVMLPETVTMYYGVCVDEMATTPLFINEDEPKVWVQKNRTDAKIETWGYLSIEQDVK